MWTADKIAYRGEENFIRAYQGSELLWELPNSNKIFYTTSDNQIINIPYSGYYWGDNVDIISNTYTGNQGVIEFNGVVDTIPTPSPFRGTNLTSIIIPNTVNYIGSYAFAGCTSLVSISIPAAVIRLNSYTFYQCSSLSDVTLPEGLKYLSSSEFRGCTSLTRVVIPSTLLTIGDACFYGCTSLAEVIMNPTSPPASISDNFFNYNASGRLIKVPAGSVNAYKTAAGWSTYASSIVAQ